MTLGEKLKKLRTEAHLTQDELAEKLFVTRTAISKWESDRGYPNIDSLKAISKFFSITLDELLSSDEVLKIAEEDNKQRERRFFDLVYALLDMSMAMLLFLPFFAERTDGVIQSVSLMALGGVPSYLKAAYLVTVIGMALFGVLWLVMQPFQNALWLRCKTNVSLVLGTAAVLLFVISHQPYAAVFAFIVLAIKILVRIKCG